MTYDQLLVLIPCHSLEDFPSELGEKPAESLLNAWIVPWHPVLIAEAQSMPRWRRADQGLGPYGDDLGHVDLAQPAPSGKGRLIVVPQASQEWAGADVLQQARQAGAVVIAGLSAREEMLTAALEPLGERPVVDPELVADFLAFAHVYLQIELLTRQMRNFSHIDDVLLEREIVAAAKAAVTCDGDEARRRLKACFEMLQTCRERFYPVDCYLLDLVLVTPTQAGDPLDRLLAAEQPSNLLVSGRDLDAIAAERPETAATLRRELKSGKIDVVGGEWFENVTPLLGIDSTIWQLQRGGAAYERILGRRPGVWGRKRYGLSKQMPQLLHLRGFHAGLHFVMDDGIYPDDEQTRMRWEGLGGAVLDAFSRIPVAGDSASSFLRFPQRMGETMDHDHVAAVCFARWPGLRTPWLEDFRRSAKYAPVLGRFVTLGDYFSRGDQSGRMVELRADQFLTPFLLQRVARQEPDAISRYADWWKLRAQFERGAWCESLAALIRNGSAPDLSSIEETIEFAPPDAEPPAWQAGQAAAAQMDAQGAASLTELLSTGSKATQPGWLVVNPLSTATACAVELPAISNGTTLGPPGVGGVVVAVQPASAPPAAPGASAPVLASTAPQASTPATDTPSGGTPQTGVAADRPPLSHQALVRVPSCGFAWIPAGTSAAGSSTATGRKKTDPVMAEPLVLRNGLFEVLLSDVTGGIGQVRMPVRGPNRVSHQLAFRFPRERTLRVTDGETTEDFRSYYSEMRLSESRVIANGPARGAVEVIGEIVDQETQQRLAGYRQIIEVWQGQPVIGLDIELTPERLPEGDPWSSYFAIRFAWKDPEAAQTRSWQHGAHPIGKQERIESPHYIELAKDGWRTTLLPRGLTFHRRTGPRMIDTILIVEGETRRRFQCAVAIDQPYPLHSALGEMHPPLVRPVNGPLNFGPSGWFFQVGAPNVILTRILPLTEQTNSSDDPASPAPTPAGCVVRLLETEGRTRTFPLRCFRTPKSARQQNLLGETVHSLRIQDDAVTVTVAPNEVCDVELLW